MQGRLQVGLTNICTAAEVALNFAESHPIHIPSKVSSGRVDQDDCTHHAYGSLSDACSLNTPLFVQSDEIRFFSRTDESLRQWHEGMSALYKQIVDNTPAGEISDASMEFKFDGASRQYMKSEAFLLKCS